jgi:hypothetical protein
MQVIKIIFTKECICSELEQFLIPLCCIVVFHTFLCWVRGKFETLLGCVVVQFVCEKVFWAPWWSWFLMPGTNQWCGYMDLLFEWFYVHWCTEGVQGDTSYLSLEVTCILVYSEELFFKGGGCVCNIAFFWLYSDVFWSTFVLFFPCSFALIRYLKFLKRPTSALEYMNVSLLYSSH